MNRKRNILVIIVILLVTNMMTFYLTATGSITFGNRVVLKTESAEMADGLAKLVALKQRISKEYYKDVDDQTLMEGAIKGMFEATGDPYSAYYTEEEYQKILESATGTYEGIGVVVTQTEEGYTQVVTPYRGTPAGNAGIQAGDIIVKVNDEEVTTKGMEYVVGLMRGEAGTAVAVTVSRNGEEIPFTLTREAIDTQTVESETIGTTGYIVISEFTDKTGDDFNSQLDALVNQGITSLIIDLRYDGGGIVNSAVAVADRLLGETNVVYTVDKAGERTDYKSTGDLKLDLPIIVLVNGGTASSSEILAGAIQDTGAGQLLGTQTFGKGIVQEVISLTDGSGYKLTNAQYFTPNGRSIHETGLTPDVVIDQSAEYQNTLNVPRDQDIQLQKALEILGGQS